MKRTYLLTTVFVIAVLASLAPSGRAAAQEDDIYRIYLPMGVVRMSANSLQQVVATIAIQPEAGPAETPVAVRGAGFDASPCGANLYWDSPVGVQLGFAFVDDGAFETNITIPADAEPGNHTIVAQGLLFSGEFCGEPSGEEASATFTVSAPPPLITLDRFDVTPGAEVTVEGANFCGDAACSGVTLYFDGLIAAEGIEVAPNGTFGVTVQVPAGVAIGQVVVMAAQTGSGGEELLGYGEINVWTRPDEEETRPPVPAVAAGADKDGGASEGNNAAAQPGAAQEGREAAFLATASRAATIVMTAIMMAVIFLAVGSALRPLTVTRAGHLRWRPAFALLLTMGALVLASAPRSGEAVAPSALTDVNPDGTPAAPYGGRAMGLTIHPGNTALAFVASEFGGVWRSADGGNSWSHVDEVPLTRSRDVLYDPQDANVVIATGFSDGRFNNQGGIWRSADGGTTWEKPAASNPGCTPQAHAWGIAVPDHATQHVNVYVGTSCGVAISGDSGATWSHVDPCTAADAGFCGFGGAIYDVSARVVGGSVQVDVCGAEGVFRSADGGTNWSAPDPASPMLTGLGSTCKIDTASNDADTVYLAHFSGLTPPPPPQFCVSQLLESTTGGTAGSWVDMQVSANNCRDPWVVTHPALDGHANHFEVYYGDSQRMRRQHCDATATPRCQTGVANWPTADSGAHADPSDIAFDTTAANGCPQILSTDGGISTSGDCGATWDDGNSGLHALDIRALAGTVEIGHTDLYFGTQDNGLYFSQDNAATWSRPDTADVYNVFADHTAPVNVLYRRCFGCVDLIGGAHVAGVVAFNDPPGNVPVTAVATQFGFDRYVFVTADNSMPAQWTAYVTTDGGGSWNQLGPSPLPGSPGEIKASGPAAAPTFHLRLNVGGQRRIYRLSGALDSTATLTWVSAGLLIPSSAWDVDPADPNTLYASDVGTGQMMFTTNGGTNWNPDAELTDLITHDGEFRFWPTIGPMPTSVAFDQNSETIMVGTRTAGLFVSITDGQAWLNVPGAESLPRFLSYFFDESDGAIYTGTSGRGIWRIDLPLADLSITKSDAPDPVVAGEQLVYTIVVENDGPDTATDVQVIDTLPSQVSFAGDTAPGNCIEGPTDTLTCDLGDIANGGMVQFTITVDVDADAVFNNGGPLLITNEAELASTTPDDDLSDNDVSEDTLVVAEADLEIVSFEAVDPPAQVLVGEDVAITLRKVITNNGPSAPMDVEVTQTATAPPDATVTPAMAVSTEPALALNELREVFEVFTINCGAASHHTFVFDNEIQPLHPADVDPDQSNNTATVELDIECVVPVALNIKPGSFPNSINPNSRDVIPLAILTTAAGEYGLPLAFDATTIDPLSVRFGPPDEVWDETGGAFEAHGRGHVEDAKELDESTMDGDMDMVLHFHVQETGIGPGDTEACVKGEWVDGNGDTHTFFGCDSVRIVPSALP